MINGALPMGCSLQSPLAQGNTLDARGLSLAWGTKSLRRTRELQTCSFRLTFPRIERGHSQGTLTP